MAEFSGPYKRLVIQSVGHCKYAPYVTVL